MVRYIWERIGAGGGDRPVSEPVQLRSVRRPLERAAPVLRQARQPTHGRGQVVRVGQVQVARRPIDAGEGGPTGPPASDRPVPVQPEGLPQTTHRHHRHREVAGQQVEEEVPLY